MCLRFVFSVHRAGVVIPYILHVGKIDPSAQRPYQTQILVIIPILILIVSLGIELDSEFKL